jgi:Phage integrase family
MAAEALRALLDSQADERLLAGARWQDTGLVFTTHLGAALDAGNVRKTFKRVCTAAGAGDGWTPRELRTSFVSLLSHRGVSIEEIARLAGHASTRTTEVVYRRELRPVITTGAEVMDELLGEARSQRPSSVPSPASPKSFRIRICQSCRPRLNGTHPPGLTGDSHQGDAMDHTRVRS